MVDPPRLAEPPVNWRRVAINLGQAVIDLSTLNEIDRAGAKVFAFQRREHPEASVTSSRSQRVIDWVLTLAEQPVSDSEKAGLLRDLAQELAPRVGLGGKIQNPFSRPDFSFLWSIVHPTIRAVAEPRFDSGQMADAVESALKEVNSRVKREHKTSVP